MLACANQIHSGQPHSHSFCLPMLSAFGLYVHSMPGRLRVELPALLNNHLLTRRLEQVVEGCPGVRRASGSPYTGRLLIEYDQHEIDVCNVMSCLEKAGVLPGCNSTTMVANSLLDTALEQALKLGVKLALGI